MFLRGKIFDATKKQTFSLRSFAMLYLNMGSTQLDRAELELSFDTKYLYIHQLEIPKILN